ncbi:hypothetical protein [Brazilian marseillevirus]|uniref:hypothetical protein n=1 Tax=Brazilian marseillevirus TaxID=1813599 RepID=UPI00078198BA|nr:hypothetical protein A3303_gp206 [Brazilian marseillevirus]AMQ10714.1 hypothetical protein [Brazilian marseillevirus]
MLGGSCILITNFQGEAKLLMARMLREKPRVRVVYDKTSGHLLIGDTYERFSPIIPLEVSEIPEPKGFIMEGNNMSLCMASSTTPGVVYAVQESENVGFGLGCLMSTMGGNKNCAFGRDSGRCLVDGTSNSFFGKASGWKMVDGSSNTILGSNSAGNMEKGERNVFVGSLSGTDVVNGQSNVFIGFNTKSLFPDVSESIAIGYGAVVEGNNEVSFSRHAFTFRARGLRRRDDVNAEMLAFDQETGLLHPIRYPTDNKNLKPLENSDVLALDVYQKDGRATVCLSDLEKLSQLSVTDFEGNVVGLSHSNLLLHLLFAVQRIQKEKGCSASTKQGLEALTKSFNEFRDSNFQNLSSINKTNEVLLAKLFQFSDISKKVQEMSERQNLEEKRRYSLKEKSGERYEKQCSQNKVFGETLDVQGQRIEQLEGDVKNLTLKIQEKDEALVRQEKEISLLSEKYEALSRVQDARIRSLEEKIVSLLESAEAMAQFMEKRPVSPLCVSAVGELQKRTIPLADVFEDWENISQ